MKIVHIKDEYINCLFEKDTRVCYNKGNNEDRKRPYLGPILEVNGYEYYTPMSSSYGGGKLKENEKEEDNLFFPLDNCQLGGLKLNNMIPVLSSVRELADIKLKPTDDSDERSYKILLDKQRRYVNRYELEIKNKASELYLDKTVNGMKDEDNIKTCNFLTLEKIAARYEYNAKNGLPQQSLIAEYGLTQELYKPIEKNARKRRIPVEVLIRKAIVKNKTGKYNPEIKARILAENELGKKYGLTLAEFLKVRRRNPGTSLAEIEKNIQTKIMFSPAGKYNPKIKEKLINGVESVRHQPKKNQQKNTQEKNSSKPQSIAIKPKKKDADQNSR